MSTQRFSHTQYPINALVEQIDSGELSLPDLQRPFVWDRSKVRDLFDSLYHGYPAGYFLLWSTTSSVDSHAVATAPGSSRALKMIIDGQQRLTSLYSVMKGREVVTEDNELRPIRLAFNPTTEEFAVADAAREKDPEWVPNISEMWTGGNAWTFTNAFLQRLSASRDVTGDEAASIGERLGKLQGLGNYQFSALELSGDLDIDEVAEVFVRINSQGVPLNSADFILTLMSVHEPEARHRLEDFSRAAKVPSTSDASPYNRFHAPSPDQLLRVAVGLGLRRGVLQNAYQALRGRDPVTKVISEDLREEAFGRLTAAQAQVLNLTSWHEYLLCVKAAGYRGKSMLTSVNNFLYCYLFFLIGRNEFKVEQHVLRKAIARWFFMSSLTGRYTGSPETMIEADLRRFGEAESAEDFIAVIDTVVETQLTADYWNVSLPDQLDSAAAWSPALYAYHASLILLEARALFSDLKIADLLDPAIKATKSPVERHHLFPKAYLSSLGITGVTRTNQIANYAFLEWSDNIAISHASPAEYFPTYFERIPPSDQEIVRHLHALPPRWEEMEYFEFLRARRRLMAGVIREGFMRLSGGAPAPGHRVRPAGPTVAELLRQMETHQVEFKQSARVPANPGVPESVINEGIVKTVAAFLNSDGGTLAIGISDEGDVVGIQPDLDLKHQDLDGYQNWLSTLLINKIGGGVVGSHVALRIEEVGSEVVVLVDVRPAPQPVYAKTGKGDAVFFVRVANTTRILEGPELVQYIRAHWQQ